MGFSLLWIGRKTKMKLNKNENIKKKGELLDSGRRGTGQIIGNQLYHDKVKRLSNRDGYS